VQPISPDIRHTASAAQDAGPADYPRFHAAVALAQLTSWLPPTPQLLIDISGPGSRAADVAVWAGHSVLRVIDPISAPEAASLGPPANFAGDPPGVLGGARGDGGRESPRLGNRPPGMGAGAGRLVTVTAEGGGLEFLADGCADGVIAEDRTLSLRLAAEDLVAEIARVLRPGGRVLACVDSLTFGMAVLAEQHRWPHLVDVPNADVVLIPWPDGTITRCYGSEQLGELFTGGGLEVSWIRPRTVFSPQTVSYLLARDPGRFGELVNAELRARSDDSVGAQLVTCAVRH
jgi:SAM-dependent methyltransferase